MKKHRFQNWVGYVIWLLPFAGLLLAWLYLAIFGLHRRLESSTGAHLRDLGAVEELTVFRQTAVPEDLAKIDDAISSTDSLAWGSVSSLTLIVLLASALVAGYVIWKAPADIKNSLRWICAIILTLIALVTIPILDYRMGFLARQIVMTTKLVGVIQSHLNAGGSLSVNNIETFFLEAGYGAALSLVVASGLTLLRSRELIETGMTGKKLTAETIDKSAHYTAMQIKHQRAILYAGALLLVIITFRQNVTLRWALDYLQPPAHLEKSPGFGLAKFLFQRLEILVSSIVMGTGVLNTLLLAGLYVPAALVLQRRAIRLSRLAVAPEKGARDAPISKEQTEWMERHGLDFPLRDQLPKVAAILSPLLAGPMGQLLSFLK